MAIRSGSWLHDANGFTVDRIQSAGVSNLNIPEEKIYELGNWESVDILRDTADLSFDIESLDMSTEIEALITGVDPGTVSEGDSFDFIDAMPIDIISPFKSRAGDFDIVKGIVVPYLTLEGVTYRFGVRQNSTQQFTFRGDSIYYTPAAPFQQEMTLVNGQMNYTFTHTAQVYNQGGDVYYALSACVKNESTGAYKRLFLGSDYTNSSASITLTSDFFDDGYTTLHVTYATGTAISYTQDGNNPHGETVHEGVGIKPGAVRGRDVEVWVANSSSATPTLEVWDGVQSVEVSRRVNLEPDEELGNYNFTAYDYDTADVTGTITLQPKDLDSFWDKLRKVSGVTATNEVIGPYGSNDLEVEIRIKSPTTGDVLKTLLIEDAKFALPALTGQVEQKVSTPFTFTSVGGNLEVFAGERP